MANEILTEQELEAISGGKGETTAQEMCYSKDGKVIKVTFKNRNCASPNPGFIQKMNIEDWALALESWEILGDRSKLAEAAFRVGFRLPRNAKFTLIKIGDEWELYKG